MREDVKKVLTGFGIGFVIAVFFVVGTIMSYEGASCMGVFGAVIAGVVIIIVFTLIGAFSTMIKNK